jgi:hypothetical protein
MRNSRVFDSIALLVLTFALMAAIPAKAQVNLLAIAAFTDSRAGYYKDLSGLRYNLENGAAANLLGGLGSAIAWASGNTFLALPDRGPNTASFNSLIDDTVTQIPRFHTLSVDLEPDTGGLEGACPSRARPRSTKRRSCSAGLRARTAAARASTWDLASDR